MPFRAAKPYIARVAAYRIKDISLVLCTNIAEAHFLTECASRVSLFKAFKRFFVYLFFLIIKHTVAIAFVIRVGNFFAEILAHAFSILVFHEQAGAIASRAFKAFLYGFDHFFIFVKLYFHKLIPYAFIRSNEPTLISLSKGIFIICIGCGALSIAVPVSS